MNHNHWKFKISGGIYHASKLLKWFLEACCGLDILSFTANTALEVFGNYLLVRHRKRRVHFMDDFDNLREVNNSVNHAISSTR